MLSIFSRSQFHSIADQAGKLVVGTMTSKPENRVKEKLQMVYKCKLADYDEEPQRRYD